MLDKIDAWIKKTLDGSPKQSETPQAQPQSGQNLGAKKHFKKRRGGKKGSFTHKPHQSKQHGSHNAPHGKQNAPKAIKIGKRITAPKRKSGASSAIAHGKVKIIPLGGLNEVGKNMTVIEYEDDIIIVDMGLEFPSEDMLGIDYVIPDISYLEENRKRIKGIVITHAHLDHIGGIPYILPKLDFPPLYATKLTIGLIEQKIKEFKQDKTAKLNTITSNDFLRLGKILVSFFSVNHSIPGALGIVIDTPVGKIVHTGDFKFDATPARNMEPAETDKMIKLGSQNVLALLCESTNSSKPGHTISESEVGLVLDQVVGETKERLIIASFASQVGRIQQIFDAAQKHNRKIFVSGRSMLQTIETSARLGYLSFPKDLMMDIKRYNPKNVPDRECLIITTGAQGEAISALSRIARNEHPHIMIKKGDTVVLSSSPIIGNERSIATVVNNLAMLGAKIIHSQIMDVHTSGHAKQDELAEMINYIKPKYLVPIHGEYYMRSQLADLAVERCGIPEENIMMLQNGSILLAEKDQKMAISKEFVDTKYILIDGHGEGTADSGVLMDRQIMAQNGALIVLLYVDVKTKRMVRKPDIVSRGFIYQHESDEISEEIGKVASDAFSNIMNKNPGAQRQDVKRYVKQSVDKYTHTKLERRPLIIPLIIEA